MTSTYMSSCEITFPTWWTTFAACICAPWQMYDDDIGQGVKNSRTTVTVIHTTNHGELKSTQWRWPATRLQAPIEPAQRHRVAVRQFCRQTRRTVGRMRVDLSPRLGGHTVANQPPPLLSSSHSPSFSPRGTVQGLSAGVEQSHELNLNLRFTLLWPSWLDYRVPTTPCTSRLKPKD